VNVEIVGLILHISAKISSCLLAKCNVNCDNFEARASVEMQNTTSVLVLDEV
jgi:hypothetical protein